MLNKVFLIGRLGKDVELSYTSTGKAVARFSLATSDKFTKDGQKQERTEWHRVTVFDKQAEICSQYLRKGSQAYIEGSIRYGEYEKEGAKVYTTDIIARNIRFLDSNSESSSAPVNNAPQSMAEANPFQSQSIEFSMNDIPF